MNSLVSKVIDSAVAGYQAENATILLNAGQSPSTRQAPANVKQVRAPKPQLEVELDWDSESTLYSGFGDEPEGVFVATYATLPIGTVVDVEIAFPDGRTFKTTGRVQWKQEPRDVNDETVPGLGIQFTQVADHPSWNPPRPEVLTPSMPPIRVVSIHPLGPEETDAVNAFGQARPPTFFID
jgi:hypothetical protein